MLGRELAIVLRARLTWTIAALAALLVGHSLVLAIDVYSSGSRAVAGHALMAREFDPLAGIVRPTLGGLYLAASLLAPLLAARGLAVEKERRTFRALALMSAAPARLVLAKYVAALAGAAILVAVPLAALGAWRALGGHLAAGETAVALLGHALYLGLVAALAVAAAAWTRTFPQAATLAIVTVLASWAIDAADGFAALAWLGRAADWSATTHLVPFERGTLALGSVAWFLVLTAGLLALACVGARFDLAPARRAALGTAIALATVASVLLAGRTGRAWDATEAGRASLPPAVVTALRALPERLTLEVWLDRDDSRRRQMESDTLAKLRLARPDLLVLMPLDARDAPAEATRDDAYGRVFVRVGARTATTYSTSRTELVALIFEAAGRRPPAMAASPYPGYPRVVEGARRRALLLVAYVLLPAALLGVGYLLTRTPRREP